MTLREQWRSLAAWFWRRAGAVSIRTKILGIVLSLMVVLGSAVTIQVHQMMESSSRARLKKHSVSLAGVIAARVVDPILINDLVAVDELLRDTKANNEELRYAFVLDAEGRVLAHTFQGGFPLALIGLKSMEPEDASRTQRLSTNEDPVWDTATPILQGTLGYARVGLSESKMNQTVNAITARLLMTTVLVSVAGILVGGFFTWILTRPILALVAATKAVGRGDLTRRVGSWADDEIGELAQSFNSMTEGLARAQRVSADRTRLRAELLRRVISAQEEERKRIARELHDETGQVLTSILIGLRRLEDECPIPTSCGPAEQLREVTARALDDVHSLALELRPSVLDDMGLVAAVGRLVSDLRDRNGVSIELAAVGLETDRLPGPVEVALYRIVQEGLTNAVRHAEAETISVLLERRSSRVRILVEDDGCGFDSESALSSTERLGLVGMKERVELLGGSVTVESKPHKGTTIHIDILLEAEEQARTDPVVAGSGV